MGLKVKGLKFKVRAGRNFLLYTFYSEVKIYICIVKQRQWCSAYLNRCKADDAYPNKLFIYLHVGYV
jgi:hypothetical protein